jgi:uncharacterized membrane protein YfhO
MNVAVLLSSEQRPDLELLSVEGEILAYQVPDPWPRVVTAGCLDSSYGLQCDRIESGSAAISFETSSQVSIEVTAEENLDVLLLDTYYPGWTATLDGDPVQITLANRMFRAVPVPRGNHQIVMTYRPLSLILGAITTGIALAMWGGAWIYSRANRLSKSHSQEGQM